MIEGNITRASYADESYSGRQWYRTTVLAHVKATFDLSWILKIENEARKLGYIGEIKASFAFRIIKHMDIRSQKRIWSTIQDIPISIIDPRYYLKKIGIVPLNESCYQYLLYGKTILINKANPLFHEFEKFLHQSIAEQILIDSPLPDIENAINKISESFEVFHSMTDFEPRAILDGFKSKDAKKRMFNVAELSLRLFSAFYELGDPDVRQDTIDRISFYGMELFWPVSRFYKELLIQSITNTRYFDEGQRNTIEFIRTLLNKVRAGLSHDIFEPQIILPEPKIIEVRSVEDIRIRASDVVAGIARIIYDYSGLEGLKRIFRLIFLNGTFI